MMQVAERKFSFVRGSDNERDGMYLEVSEQVDGRDLLVLEVFYLDGDGKMTFSAFEQDLPFELLEIVAQVARERLTPVSTIGATS